MFLLPHVYRQFMLRLEYFVRCMQASKPMRYLRVETITSDYDEAHVLIFSLQMNHVSELCMYAYGILRPPQNSTPSPLYHQRQLE